jgi:NADPH-dependent F420 reductase
MAGSDLFSTGLLIVVICMVVVLREVDGYPNFAKLIPNGEKVRFNGEKWPAVGHTKVYGGGDLNVFGKDFMRAGNEWTEELCRKDSDGDGRTNGEELGDPNCEWKLGEPSPKARFVTHPGVADECPSPAPSPSVMKIAILGSGNVGRALHRVFSDAGIMVAFGVRNLDTHIGGGTVFLMKEAADWATIVFLAVPGNAVVEIATELQAALRAKVIVDCTNPVKWDKGPIWDPPAAGSNTAAIAAVLPDSRVVKAFNSFGVEHMEDPGLSSVSAQVFIAGDDSNAKKLVSQICERTKFRSIDAGPLRNAALLENMAVLWIHLATVGGKGREFIFATLPE